MVDSTAAKFKVQSYIDQTELDGYAALYYSNALTLLKLR